MGYHYKVIPFLAEVKIKGDTIDVSKVADQLSEVLTRELTGGWELYTVSTVYLQSKPGCLGILGGARADYRPTTQLVLRRPE